MPGYLYPPPAETFTGDIESIHRLLARPLVVARKVQDMLTQRYIADAVLKGRFKVVGGSISYETGEPLGTEANPRAIAPGGDYPIVDLGGGVISTAKTTKWGEDVPIYDESIARMLIQPVNTAFNRLVNQNVMFIDSIAIAVISTAITNSTPAAAVWTLQSTTAAQILQEVLVACANVRKLDLGNDPDTVVLDDLVYASVMSKFIAAGYLPREGGNPLVTGNFPSIGGLTWLPTNHGIATTALLVDTEDLGGMADEDLGSPGYAKASAPGTTGVETKIIRDEKKDRYLARARRVTVPAVTNRYAGWKITGVA